MEGQLPKYVHTEVDHNLIDPALLIPLFQQFFSPASVCDVGCGIGNFLYVFKQQGVKKVLGLDGAWTDQKLVAKYLCPDEFRRIDFEEMGEEPLERFDVCICLEVAEHVSEQKADSFLNFLTGISNIIIFSAALPYQGGINHINEQKEDYWQHKFEQRGFSKYDIIRHQIFAQKKISAHYRRNILVYSNQDLSRFQQVDYTSYAIQENCMHRLHVELITGRLSLRKLVKFLLKIISQKLAGKNILQLAKKWKTKINLNLFQSFNFLFLLNFLNEGV